jgi:hypothetical protein
LLNVFPMILSVNEKDAVGDVGVISEK